MHNDDVEEVYIRSDFVNLKARIRKEDLQKLWDFMNELDVDPLFDIDPESLPYT